MRLRGVSDAVGRARHLVLLVGADFSSMQAVEAERFLRETSGDDAERITVAILLPDADLRRLPSSLKGLETLRISTDEEYFSGAFLQAAYSVLSASSTASAVTYDREARRRLGVAYRGLGDLTARNRDLAETERIFLAGTAFMQRSADEDPADTQVQGELSVFYLRLGDVRRERARFAEAEGAYRDGLTILRRLAAADPADTQTQRDLSTAYSGLGVLMAEAGKPTEADDAHRQSLELSAVDHLDGCWSNQPSGHTAQ